MCVPAPHPASPRGPRTMFVAVIILFAGYGLLALSTIPVSAGRSRRGGAQRRWSNRGQLPDEALCRGRRRPRAGTSVSLHPSETIWIWTKKIKNLNVRACRHAARPPLALFLACTKSLISIAECFVSTRKPTTEFHLGFDVESRGGNWGSWIAWRE